MARTKVTNLEKLQKIVDTHTALKINKMWVDATTANVIIKVYNALDSNKQQYAQVIESDLIRAADIAWQLVK